MIRDGLMLGRGGITALAEATRLQDRIIRIGTYELKQGISAIAERHQLVKRLYLVTQCLSGSA
jgi:hypothetical protein